MHLGVFTFLRRARHPYPPLPPGAGAQPKRDVPMSVAPPVVQSTTSPLPERPSTPAAPTGPITYHSDRYGYRLELPAGWRSSPVTVVPGAPLVERFAPATGLPMLDVWHEPCTVRRLPPVPLAERAASIPLGSGLVVPFVTYRAMGNGETVFLEGRWLHRGRRWTVNAKLPAVDGSEGVETVRDLLRTLVLDD